MSKHVNCPECGHKNPIADSEARKLTCGDCGMILVLAKLEVVEDGPKKPVIQSRRQKQKSGADEAPAETKKSGGRSRRRPVTRGSSRRREAEPEPEVEESRRRTAGGRAKHKNQTPPAVMALSLLGLVAIVGAVVWFVMQGGEEQPVKDKESAAVAQAETPPAQDTQDKTDGPSETALADDVTNAAVVDKPKDKPAKAKKPAKKPTKPKASRWDFEPFARPASITDEQDAAIKKNIETLLDINATRTIGIAQRALKAVGKDSVGYLLNAWAKLDPAKKEEVFAGAQIKDALHMVTLNSFDNPDDREWDRPSWRDDTGEDRAFRNAVIFRTQARGKWGKWWKKNEASWAPPTEEDF